MAEIRLLKGDCLELMRNLPDRSVDLVLCDPPYGTTAHKWDCVLSFQRLWEEYRRVLKEDGVAVLFATQPFTSILISSNLDDYRYSWIWEKDTPTGFLNSTYCPLKKTEDICVFSKATVGSKSKNKIRFFPQGVVEVNKVKQNNPNTNFRELAGYNIRNNVLNSDKLFISRYENYPVNILKFKRDKESVHPTQKPVALLEYLIKTYTKEGEVVLDNTMGSGSTGVACKNTGRSFIGMELDDRYFKIAESRINEVIYIEKEDFIFDLGEKNGLFEMR